MESESDSDGDPNISDDRSDGSRSESDADSDGADRDVDHNVDEWRFDPLSPVNKNDWKLSEGQDQFVEKYFHDYGGGGGGCIRGSWILEFRFLGCQILDLWFFLS